MLGISLYPDKTSIEQDQAYLELAKQYGYQVVFMSFLQIDIKNPKQSIERIIASAKMAKAMGFSVTLDIHPMVFHYLPKKEDDLCFFYDMGVSTLRLDSTFNARTEAMMTRNPYGIQIELNMSNDTAYLSHILDYQPNVQRLCGSHNFYPQRFTGLSRERFLTCSKKFREHHIQSAAFITSQCADISPWPVSEGLCTLELHRDLDVALQARHMKMMHQVDTIIIANAFASEEELRRVREAMQEGVDDLHMVFYEGASALEKELVLAQEHEYRGDTGDYVIRSSKARMKYAKESVPAHRMIKAIHRGDVLVLNEQYGQYKAELQIALIDREGDERINVVGHIVPEEMILLEELRPFQKFNLKVGALL